ncbi:dipeptide epimerase [Wenzhouxiangella sp. AB-CW3]|uniref:N-acetyl-D-Glu racemase DgcA n=1 Tax=Wenzhouxiangella sp. AB-CW3 TaxID=2771012 RepID=UPI00168AAFC6|nr:N-acetyl-D-Glu racemase DgcA [Wenzhouxiangella sp. AB-CW3]QOC21746.1 dipeptide epimerase [Wenzhouxiangella sp. AB-CW3]
MRQVTLRCENWNLHSPFIITGHVFTVAEILYVEIADDRHVGRGEASGVYYLGETAQSMLEQAESVRSALEGGAGREVLLSLLPAGGARNAIDCALWDLEARRSGQRVWELAGISPRAITTFQTVSLDSPDRMAAAASRIAGEKIKVKLDGDQALERIAAVRRARQQAEIIVDANQGWTFEQLQTLAPAFRDLRIAMIEQPLPRGDDEVLEDYMPPLPLCADESCLDRSEFEVAASRYQMINIKLDKTGGLTEALALARLARDHGLELMVGNMVGTSLAMAPGYVVAQLCRYADLDGPLLLESDRECAMSFEKGRVSPPQKALWG